MTVAAPQVLPDFTKTGGKTRFDGATLACVYALAMTVIPAALVIKGLPMSLTPGVAIGLVMGVVWFLAQMVTTLGVAKGRNAARTALFIFTCSQLATYGYATYGYLPGDELAAADRTLITVMAVVAVGIAVTDGVRGMARIDRLLKTMIVGATFMAFVGVLQFMFALDLTQYLMLPGLRANGELSHVLERSNFRRPAGTSGHPIEFGVVCAMTVPLALHYALRGVDHGGQTKRWWLCLAILAVASMQSLSRSAILGLAIAAIFIIPAMAPKRRVKALWGMLGFLVAMRLMVPGLVGTLLSLFTSISVDPSAESRRRAVERAGKEIPEHLWLGRGLGTYLPEKYGWLDNQYLGTLVQNGVIGLTLLIFLYLAGMYCAFRARLASKDPRIKDLGVTLAACIAVPGISSATFDLIGFAVATGYTFLLIGVAGALWRTVQEQPGGIPPLLPTPAQRPRRLQRRQHRDGPSAKAEPDRQRTRRPDKRPEVSA
ncbi:O-antigen ligase [Actinokineospora baliensis]|uniref:O-antigen ligase family protein n=1 Tax=Actinokineospora baliensis TaxID=547056 RepID=UPI0027DE676A|nr:O-antigen ligase family protein [Actinokineospora baliensis]MBM7770559.1 O-antigen ligase [Actinokineospora baliensis]